MCHVELLYPLLSPEKKKKNKTHLQVILSPFTHEIHNVMLNTSIGSFLFGVVMMLKVTLSTVQVLRSKTVPYPLLTDNYPMALGIQKRKTPDVQLYNSESHVAHGNLGLQIHSNSNFEFCCFFPWKAHSAHIII